MHKGRLDKVTAFKLEIITSVLLLLSEFDGKEKDIPYAIFDSY